MRLLVVWLVGLVHTRSLKPAYCPVRRIAGALLLVLLASSQAGAQVTPSTLAAAGMEQMWQGQVEMPLGRGSIVSTHLWTSPTLQRQYAEITFPVVGSTGSGSERTIRVSADTLGRDGKPIGMAAAKLEAEALATRTLRRAPGVQAKEVVVPQIFLIVVTSDGHVQAFDAETGEPLWANSAGSPTHPASPASVSDAGVAVVHGVRLVLFDLLTGKQVSSIRLKHVNAAGVALVGQHAFVPNFGGQVVVYDFAEQSFEDPWRTTVIGHPVGTPASSSRELQMAAVATDRGHVTIFSAAKGPTAWFDFRGKSSVVGPVSFSGNGIYFGDADGQVMKLASDRQGRLQWRVILGQTLRSPVIAVAGRAYIVTELGRLLAVDDLDGTLLWKDPPARVKEVLAVSETRMYCRSLSDRVLIVDIATGKILNESGPATVGASVHNALNDRLYVITPTGRIVALREAGKQHALPRFHTPPAAVEPGKGPTGGTPAPTVPEAVPADAVDPFSGGVGGGADPFSAPAAPAAGAAGGAAAAADDDPFASPF
jgi:outer membrane protein assembly factor BamB